jgi:glycosyltransferase involved in cell wall biosynthesis
LLFATTVPITISAFLLPYARRYREAGYQVDAVADGARNDPTLAKDFDGLWNVPWKRNPLHPLNLLALALFYRGVRRRRYVIVHVHTPVAAFFGRLAVALLRRRRPFTVYTVHGFHFTAESREFSAKALRVLERIAVRWTDIVIVLTEEDKEQALALGFPRDRVALIPGIGIDSRFYEASRVLPDDVQELRGRLGIGPAEKVFVCIAEFNRNKRQADLVRALALLDDDIHLAFAGSGLKEPAVRSLAAALGVSERVHFLGVMADVRPLISLSTGVVLASAREGMPRCLLEAMSLATPIIATDVRGSRELARQGGLVVPPRDVRGLAQAMRVLADDPERGRRLGLAGRAAVVETYEWERVATRQDEIYARLRLARSRFQHNLG